MKYLLKMEKLEFSTNWNNKLDCKCFTTIRIFNPMKHNKGNNFEIILQKKFKAKAIVIGVVKTKLSELTDYVCYLDTGYNKEETTRILLKMYPRIDFATQLLAIVLLKKIVPPKAVQNELFN